MEVSFFRVISTRTDGEQVIGFTAEEGEGIIVCSDAISELLTTSRDKTFLAKIDLMDLSRKDVQFVCEHIIVGGYLNRIRIPIHDDSLLFVVVNENLRILDEIMAMEKKEGEKAPGD